LIGIGVVAGNRISVTAAGDENLDVADCEIVIGIAMVSESVNYVVILILILICHDDVDGEIQNDEVVMKGSVNVKVNEDGCGDGGGDGWETKSVSENGHGERRVSAGVDGNDHHHNALSGHCDWSCGDYVLDVCDDLDLCCDCDCDYACCCFADFCSCSCFGLHHGSDSDYDYDYDASHASSSCLPFFSPSLPSSFAYVATLHEWIRPRRGYVERQLKMDQVGGIEMGLGQ